MFSAKMFKCDVQVTRDSGERKVFRDIRLYYLAKLYGVAEERTGITINRARHLRLSISGRLQSDKPANRPRDRKWCLLSITLIQALMRWPTFP